MTEKKPSIQAFSVGYIAKRSGVSVSTLHFYEQKGLISSHRNAGNQRRYVKSVLRRIAVIKTAQSLGMTLTEIQSALSHLPPHRAPDKHEWKRLSVHWQQALDQKIQLLSQLRDELDTCIGCGCLSMKSCPLRNPDDILANEGSGAVKWEKLSPSSQTSEG